MKHRKPAWLATILLGIVLCFAAACGGEEKALESISLNTEQVQTTFAVGDAFTYEGLVVTAHYSDNSSEEVTEYSVAAPDMTSAGEKTVVVTYGEKSANYTVNVFANEAPGRAIQSITLNTDEVQKNYTVGDTVNTEHLVVTAHYNTDPREVIVDEGHYEVTPDEEKYVGGVFSVAGTVSVRISCEGKFATYDVTVSEPEPVRALQNITLNSDSAKKEYFVGDTLDASNLVVTAHYNTDPKEVTVPAGDYTATPEAAKYESGKFSETGKVKVTVSYQGQTAEYEVTVKAVEIASIALSGDYKTSYFEGDTLDTSKLVVTATYNNNTTRALEAGEYTVTVDEALKEGDALKVGG